MPDEIDTPRARSRSAVNEPAVEDIDEDEYDDPYAVDDD